MRKETNMMFIIVTCAILGIIACGVISILHSNGIIIDEIATNEIEDGEGIYITENTSISLDEIMIIIIIASIIAGIVLSVFKR